MKEIILQEPQAETKNKRVTPRDYKEWDK